MLTLYNYFGKVEDKYDLAIVEGVSSFIQSTEKWINENGYKPKGALREIYHKGSWLDIPEEEYITELQIEIAK